MRQSKTVLATLVALILLATSSFALAQTDPATTVSTATTPTATASAPQPLVSKPTHVRVVHRARHIKHRNPHEQLRKLIPLWFRAKLPALRGCENYGSYRQIVENNYYKAYQFSASTWYSLGYKISPAKASPPLQDWAAYRLWKRDGPNSWPVCRRVAGL